MSATLMDTTPELSPLPDGHAGESTPPPVLTATHVPKRENPLVAIFFGPNGMYPGTRFLIYVAIALLAFLLIGGAAHFLQPRPAPVWWSLVTQVIVTACAIGPAFVMGAIENRPFADFGIPWRNAFRRNFWVGAVWGIAWLTVLMLTLNLTGAFSFGKLSIHGISIAKFAVYYAVYFLFTGFFEEFLLRGYPQWVLTRGMNFWPAAALLSALFGAMHSANPGESKVGLVAAGLIGFFFCLTLRRTGDLWWAIGFHMSWDWGESYLYSVPDSGGMMPGHLLNSSFHGPQWLTGGSVGPEGSLLVFVVVVAMWVLFDRMYPEVKYPG